MQQLLLTNIERLVNVRENTGSLRGKGLAHLPILENAFLLIENGRIKDYGLMSKLSTINHQPSTVNCQGSTVLPAWCDSHTHLVFATSREEEFVDKINGLSYAEIAAKGGGILNSARKLNAMSEDELYDKAFQRLHQLILLGTGAIEIKSGYGLSVEGELKMLRVIQRLKQNFPIPIKATFLGAHTFPLEFKNNHEAYIKLIVDEMLPNISKEKLADYIDVFCEEGFFNVDEMKTICNAGMNYGLKPKLHVNQLNSIGGIKAGIDLNAISLDHLETMTDEDIDALTASNTMATMFAFAGYCFSKEQHCKKIGICGAITAYKIFFLKIVFQNIHCTKFFHYFYFLKHDKNEIKEYRNDYCIDYPRLFINERMQWV